MFKGRRVSGCQRRCRRGGRAAQPPARRGHAQPGFGQESPNPTSMAAATKICKLKQSSEKASAIKTKS